MAKDPLEIPGEKPPPIVVIRDPAEGLERPRAAALIPFKGDWEGNDKGFETENGFKIRARIKLTDKAVVKASQNTDAATAPTQFTLTVTVASLLDDLSVETFDGKVVLTDAHEITVTDEGLARGMDLTAEIMRTIGELAARAEDVSIAKKATMAKLKSDWGI